jgi:hypothetical protein
MLDKNIAVDNLKDLDIIFRKNNAPAWLQDGTLLGLHRENDFIAHDLDTDMGMMFVTFNKKILEDTTNFGFEHYFIGYIDECCQVVFKRNGVKTDLFFYYEDNGGIYHSAFHSPNPGKEIIIDYNYKKFDLKEREFFGHLFLVPKDELYFIETKYGENWQIPEKNWSYAYSPKNHKITDREFTWEEYERRMSLWNKNQESNQ